MSQIALNIKIWFLMTRFFLELFYTIGDSASECKDVDLADIGCLEISVFCKTYGMRNANKIVSSS